MGSALVDALDFGVELWSESYNLAVLVMQTGVSVYVLSGVGEAGKIVATTSVFMIPFPICSPSSF